MKERQASLYHQDVKATFNPSTGLVGLSGDIEIAVELTADDVTRWADANVSDPRIALDLADRAKRRLEQIEHTCMPLILTQSQIESLNRVGVVVDLSAGKTSVAVTHDHVAIWIDKSVDAAALKIVRRYLLDHAHAVKAQGADDDDFRSRA